MGRILACSELDESRMVIDRNTVDIVLSEVVAGVNSRKSDSKSKR